MIPCQRHLFDIPEDVAYLNTAYMSPLLTSVVSAIDRGSRLKAKPWKLKISNFFDDIETNRNYFRLNLKKSKKFINKNNDTLTIKNINSNINKCTEDNMDNIIRLIIEDINKNEHLLNLVIESVLEKCILHNNYIYIYINIIKKIKEERDITRVLNNTLEKYYKFIFEEDVEKSDNIYDNLCNENKRNDNKIGYLMLMSYLL